VERTRTAVEHARHERLDQLDRGQQWTSKKEYQCDLN